MKQYRTFSSMQKGIPNTNAMEIEKNRLSADVKLSTETKKNTERRRRTPRNEERSREADNKSSSQLHSMGFRGCTNSSRHLVLCYSGRGVYV